MTRPRPTGAAAGIRALSRWAALLAAAAFTGSAAAGPVPVPTSLPAARLPVAAVAALPEPVAGAPAWAETRPAISSLNGFLFELDSALHGLQTSRATPSRYRTVEELSGRRIPVPLPAAAWNGIAVLAGLAAFGILRRRSLLWAL